ncbi:hypothetical protein EBI_25887 [Enterocytozoon bieneusi H348]|nr:hypothetical protein EBI_25887 [Enterocytozoon bieneusi H348]|eukprot:XP_001828018.1 hypothetical protein EBI_25887 [Enterocytozoon bieneusi H348]
MSSCSEKTKKCKINNLFYRLKTLQQNGILFPLKPHVDGTGSFLFNTNQIDILFQAYNKYKTEAEMTDNAECLKAYCKAFIYCLKIYILIRNHKQQYFKNLKNLHKQIIFYCEKYNNTKLKEILFYAMFIIYQNLIFNCTTDIIKSKSLEPLQNISSMLMNLLGLFKIIKNSNYSIITLDYLETELSKLYPEYFKIQ